VKVNPSSGSDAPEKPKKTTLPSDPRKNNTEEGKGEGIDRGGYG